MELNQIRKLYSEAADNATKARQLYDHLSEAHKDKTPILVAYFAASLALQARHSLNPFFKLDYIKRSQIVFQEAVKLNPEDIEIRFLRFSIQLNTPLLLGLSPNLEEDKSLIISNIEQEGLSKTMQQAIINYLLENANCTAQEKHLLQNQIQ